MLKALQQTVRVGAGGKIERVAAECPEGADVQVVTKIQAMVRRYVPEGKSLVDELIADRRAEAERE